MEKHMKRCLELAIKSNNLEKTNPKVGSVIVKNGKVIGEGYHEYYGGKHAEINAIESATDDIRGSTIYCNLEPCFHTGKQPPCVDRIIKEGFKKVIIGNRDPNPLVSGKSIQKLKDHGIEVVEGVLTEESRELNKDFYKYISTKRPYVTMKIAMSLDGKVALKNGESKWITSEKTRAHGRTLRAKNQAMLVTDTTIKNDNPSLTTRDGISPNPDVFILGDNFNVNSNLNILNKDRNIYIFTSKQKQNTEHISYIKCESHDNKFNLNEVIDQIGNLGYKNLLIESGGTLNFSALDEGIVDELYLYIAPKILGGKDSISSVMGKGVSSISEAINLKIQSIQNIDTDILIKGVF